MNKSLYVMEVHMKSSIKETYMKKVKLLTVIFSEKSKNATFRFTCQ